MIVAYKIPKKEYLHEISDELLHIFVGRSFDYFFECSEEEEMFILLVGHEDTNVFLSYGEWKLETYKDMPLPAAKGNGGDVLAINEKVDDMLMRYEAIGVKYDGV